MTDDLKFKLFLAIQLLAAVGFLFVIIFAAGPWNPARTVGLVIILPSLVLLFVARFQLGRSFSVTPQAKELVTRGLYSKIRNPIYFFGFFVVLGLVIALQKPYLYVLPFVLIVVQTVRARQEARVLEAKFGDAYREYRKKTWF